MLILSEIMKMINKLPTKKLADYKFLAMSRSSHPKGMLRCCGQSDEGCRASKICKHKSAYAQIDTKNQIEGIIPYSSAI